MNFFSQKEIVNIMSRKPESGSAQGNAALEQNSQKKQGFLQRIKNGIKNGIREFVDIIRPLFDCIPLINAVAKLVKAVKPRKGDVVL